MMILHLTKATRLKVNFERDELEIRTFSIIIEGKNQTSQYETQEYKNLVLQDNK